MMPWEEKDFLYPQTHLKWNGLLKNGTLYLIAVVNSLGKRKVALVERLGGGKENCEGQSVIVLCCCILLLLSNSQYFRIVVTNLGL